MSKKNPYHIISYHIIYPPYQISIGFGDEGITAHQRDQIGYNFDKVSRATESLWWLLPWSLSLPTKGARALKKSIQELHDIGNEMCRKHQEQLAKGVDTGKATGSLLRALCEASEASEDERLSDTLVTHNVYAFMGAGNDTTSTALGHVAVMLARHRHVQERVRKEIGEIKDLTFDALMSEMPYTSAVCKETMRLFPPLWGAVGRHTTQRVRVGGASIAKGVALIGSTWNMGVNAKVWGEDCKKFNPDRFMGGGGGGGEKINNEKNKSGLSHDLTSHDGYRALAFGGGVRSCIGKHLSVMEMKAMLFFLLKNFTLDVHDGSRPNEKHWNLAIPLIKVRPGVMIGLKCIA
eukprot:CAMPEP_0167786588 /NCGR_PEP_ID=MMETSP0111_2-20121227/8885_1 /TAXON_ID=91324 /ORGANISM="Lotharella globosa, Strain CCCM811" /LENGTH=348 /DNA_ID=CAMNT_0007678005 /DNA_START=361 /DNA_END=1407 /DNA_ORIENTATION=+